MSFFGFHIFVWVFVRSSEERIVLRSTRKIEPIICQPSLPTEEITDVPIEIGKLESRHTIYVALSLPLCLNA